MGKVILDGNADPLQAALTVRGEFAVTPTLGNYSGVAKIGAQIETLFNFDPQTGEYVKATFAEATSVTLFFDGEVKASTGTVATAFVGLGRRVSVKIPLAQFEQPATQAAFQRFVNCKRLEDLGSALAGISGTFSVQDRRLLGVALGVGLDVSVVKVTFKASLIWTDAGPARAVEYTLGEGLAFMFSQENIEDLVDTFKPQLPLPLN